MPREGLHWHVTRGVQLLLEAYAGARLPEWEAFERGITLTRLAAQEVLIRQGEPHRYLYLVHSGLLKVQATTGSGHETTIAFAEEGHLLAAIPALAPRSVERMARRGLHARREELKGALEGGSLHTVTALEPMVAARVDYGLMEDMAARHLVWANLITTVASLHGLLMQVDAIHSRDTPEVRYRAFRQTRPALHSRLTQRELAAYLNVTEVTMSRIVKRVRQAERSASVLDENPAS